MCSGICTTPDAGSNTTITICHGDEIDLTPFISGDKGGIFKVQLGNGLQDISTTLLTQEHYEVGENLITYEVSRSSEEDCRESDQALFNVIVNESPYFQFVGDTIVCNDGETTLSVSHDNVNRYEWSNGSIESSQYVDMTSDYSLTVTNVNGCAASNSVHVAILPTYEIDIIGSSSICQDQDYILQVAGEEEYESYNWSTGSNLPMTSIDSPDTYTLTTTNSKGCEAYAEITIENLEEASIQFTGADVICNGESATIGVLNDNIESYLWSTGEISSEITVTSPGKYSVTIRDQNGCEATVSKEVNGIEPSDMTISGPIVVCNDQSYTLSLESETFDSYIWSTGEDTPTISIDSPNKYSITVTDSYGCTSTSSIDIGEADEFEIEIEGPEFICNDAIETLSISNQTYERYQWSTGNHEPTLSIDNAGLYLVTVTDSKGCAATAAHRIDTYENIHIEISGPSTICENDEFTLLINNQSNTLLTDYIWTTGDIEDTVTSNEIGTYSVTVTDENNCTAVESYDVKLSEEPVAKSDHFIIPYDGTTTTFDLASNDDLPLIEGWNIEITVPPTMGELSQVGDGVYNYLQVEDQPLEVTFMYRICSETCPGQCSEAGVTLRLESFLENCDKESAMTPNGDGINDFFVTCVKNLARDYPENTLVVYNRWGQTLYTASPYDNDWNGMSAFGKPLPQSTYYYILRLKEGSSLELGGSILLIR